MTYIPGLATGSGLPMDTRYQRLYNNQMFDYLGEQMPKNIQEMFRWCEVVYHSSPGLVNGVRKLINYPITDFVYETTSEKIKKATQEFIEDGLKLRDHLITLGLDFYTYGNVFRSIYFPFTRYLRCTRCGDEINIKDAEFKVVRKKFVLSCAKCHQKRTAEIIDRNSNDLDQIKIIAWNPKLIRLFQNPITNHSSYYYAIPKEVVAGINSSDKTILGSLPEVFIEAVFKVKAVAFGKNFYHLKSPTISGFSSGWGMPPLGAILKLFLYQSILRKSNESIALEHITPKTILYPEGRTSDPTIGANMAQWREQLTTAMAQWRMDPNYVMFAPFPTGSLNIGSQGRALMPTQEIRQAEEDMILGLDIPLEFVYQKNAINPSPIALRLLENQLTPYVSQIISYANWIIDAVNAKYDKSFCHVSMTPFKLSDDAYKLQMMQNLTGTMISQSSFIEALGLKPSEERDKLKDEQVKQLHDQVEMESEQRKIQSNIAIQSEEENYAQETGEIPQYNQQKLIAQAQQLAYQFAQVPYEQRRSMFEQLQAEDYVMYSLVKSQLEAMRDGGEVDAQGQMTEDQGAIG